MSFRLRGERPPLIALFGERELSCVSRDHSLCGALSRLVRLGGEELGHGIAEVAELARALGDPTLGNATHHARGLEHDRTTNAEWTWISRRQKPPDDDPRTRLDLEFTALRGVFDRPRDGTDFFEPRASRGSGFEGSGKDAHHANVSGKEVAGTGVDMRGAT